MASEFFWYELMTTDVPAAENFYRKVVGWTAEPFGDAGTGVSWVVNAQDPQGAHFALLAAKN